MPRTPQLLQFSLWLGWTLMSACEASLDPSLERKECSSSGECLPGFECSDERLCVRRAQTKRQPDMASADASMPSDASDVQSCEEDAMCSGRCVDRMRDIDNCGACDQRCATTDYGRPVCDGGECGLSCDDGYTQCAGACYSLTSDPMHCGDCSTQCAVPANGVAVCSAGECGQRCNAGFRLCGDQCVRVEVDPANCGACDTACQADERCAQGACVRACTAGTQECARSCVDVAIDPQHCGTCEQVCLAPASSSAVCQQGVCAWQCNPSLSACNDACVDLKTDPTHCGTCNQACPVPARGRAVCKDGECAVRCIQGYMNCYGQCVSTFLLTQARQAGFGFLPVCAALAAYQNFIRCQGMGANSTNCDGTCVNPSSDALHCGACDRACEAGQVCVRSSCVNPT